MSVNIIYFISFLLFVLCAYIYGHKKMRAFLDERIEDIARTLRQADIDKEKAHKVLLDLQRDIQLFEDSLHEKEQELEKRAQDFAKDQHQKLNTFLMQQEAHHHALMSSKRHVVFEQLKTELLHAVVQEIQTHFEQHPNARASFDKTSAQLLKDIA